MESTSIPILTTTALALRGCFRDSNRDLSTQRIIISLPNRTKAVWSGVTSFDDNRQNRCNVTRSLRASSALMSGGIALDID
jgi:hypothetical protein